MLIVFKDSEHGISLLQSSLKENQFIYLLSSLKGFKNNQMDSSAFYNFFSPVKDSPASDIPLVDDAARVEVAENAFLVLCRHNSKDLQIKLSSDQTFQKLLRCRRNHLSKLQIMADNILVGDNRVSEGEDGHLSLTLATPDLNLSQGWLIEMLFW